jgi:hypothetical protein
MKCIIAAPIVLMLATSAAPAQVVTTTRIAAFGTAVPGIGPGGPETFASFGLFPSIDGSTVSFYGTTSGNDTIGAHSDIYTSTGGTISYFVHASAGIPNGTGNFTSYNPSFRYQQGNAVFVGSGTGQSGVYVSDGTTISRFADLNTAIPNGTGNFTSFSPFPSVAGLGSWATVAFTGSGSGGQAGIYFALQSLSIVGVVADRNTQVPGGLNGNFTAFGSNPSFSGFNVAFRAGFGGTSLNGVYVYDATNGMRLTIADSNTPLPNGSGTFSTTFFEPTVSGSNVSFINNNGVYALIGGTLKTIADTSTPSPNGSGNFTTISAYAPISGNEIAFIGNTATTKGVYLYDGAALHTLLDNSSSTFDGKTLAATPFFLGPDGINGNSVAFGVSFTSPSSTGVYEATFTPVPEPSTLALVGIGALALVVKRRVRSEPEA